MTKYAVVFPTLNEEKTIGKNICIAKSSRFNPQIYISDSGSNDFTVSIALNLGVIVQRNNKRGKGLALISGIRKALNDGFEYIATIDSDLTSFITEYLEKLFNPLKSNFDRVQAIEDRLEGNGLVTDYVAKPLLRRYFPKIDFKQPLTGEVAATRECWEKVLMEGLLHRGWGIDASFLIESYMMGFKIQEAYLGRKIHTSVDDYSKKSLLTMGREVSEAIMMLVMKYGRK